MPDAQPAITDNPFLAVLNPKQQLFVFEYPKDHNATKAAIRAKYSPNTADVQGTRLLANDSVQQALDYYKSERLLRLGLSVDAITKELAKIGFTNIQGLFDNKGKLKHIPDLDPDVAGAVKSIEVVEGKCGILKKVTLNDKVRALKLLAKHAGMLVDRHEHGFSAESLKPLLKGLPEGTVLKLAVMLGLKVESGADTEG